MIDMSLQIFRKSASIRLHREFRDQSITRLGRISMGPINSINNVSTFVPNSERVIVGSL